MGFYLECSTYFLGGGEGCYQEVNGLKVSHHETRMTREKEVHTVY